MLELSFHFYVKDSKCFTVRVCGWFWSYEVSFSFTFALTVLTWLLARSVPKSDIVILATCSLSHKLQMLNTLSLCWWPGVDKICAKVWYLPSILFHFHISFKCFMLFHLVNDQELARSVPELDLVVGGHSHTFLYTWDIFKLDLGCNSSEMSFFSIFSVAGANDAWITESNVAAS